MRKFVQMFTAVSLAVSLLVGCGPTQQKNETTATTAPEADDAKKGIATAAGDTTAEGAEELSGKLTIWWWADQMEIIEDFQKLYPNVEVEPVMIDAGDYLTKVQSTIASGGQLPDILMGELSFRGKLFSMDILENLEAEPYNFDRTQVVDYLIPAMTDEKDQVLGIETCQSPAGMAYKRDLAKEYLGTDDPEELEAMLKDWDSFIEKGKEVSEKSGNKITMIPSLGDVYYMINGQSKAPRISGDTIDMAAVTDTFAQVAKFRDAGIVDKIVQWTPAWFSAYGSGNSIFYPTACWGVVDYVKANDEQGKGNWGLIVPPSGGFNWGGTTMSITKSSENKLAAWKLIEFYNLTKEGTETKKVLQLIPTSKDGASDPYFAEGEDEFFAGQNIGEVWMKRVIPTIHINPITKYDIPDVMAVELVLSSMNADTSITAEQAAELYKQEMENGAPEITVK